MLKFCYSFVKRFNFTMANVKRKYESIHIDFVRDLVENKGVLVTPATRLMCDEFGFEFNDSIGRLFRKKMNELGLSSDENIIEKSNQFLNAKKRLFDSTKKVLLISWAQSYAKVHAGVLKCMEAYSDYHNGDIHIIAGRYKNPTSLKINDEIKRTEASKSPWCKSIEKYLDANRQQVHKLLTICSDIKTQPTASTPLTGFNGITGLESCIIGHPRFHLKTLPVLEGYPEKMILTTGSVTEPTYTDTRAGTNGSFHHQLGFVIVEIDGDVFHVRQIRCEKDGSFYDLNYRVSDGKVEKVKTKPLGIVLGDLHLGEEDKSAVKTSFKMIDKYSPETVVLHDVFNGHSISHHERKNPFQLLQREIDGSWSLETEIKYMVKWFSKRTNYNFVVVRSNHDDFLDRWLINEDWRKNSNRLQYLKYASILAENKAKKGIIPYILEKKFSNINALGINDSFRIGTFECGMHGHLGNGGSRGSAIQFKNLNTKNITGHTHAPICVDGHMSVGTLTKKRADYVQGPCSWDHANILIYPNGKASHIFIRNGKWTTFK